MNADRSPVSHALSDTSSTAAPASVDAASPWPGLSTFTEAQAAYFFGRDEEVRELTRRVERKALTVLFGQSGLGKSSILQAGLFPRLRAAGYCPMYVRLEHTPGGAAPAEQVKALVRHLAARSGTWTRPGVAADGETLWEFFHHRDDRLVDPSGRAIVPVLVFDQFEELFTLGAGSGRERERAVAFMSQLAELVENRPPESLVAQLETSAAAMDAFDFGRTDYRVLLSLREDYLPHLEELKTVMPALMQNRMRLTRMSTAQGVEAVVRPGGGLVSDEVAQAIVGFVSGRGESGEIEVEPSLLNLVCRELNETRRARGEEVISAHLLAGKRETILSEFYERAFAGLAPAVRHFVEDELLTDSGFRENIALERAQKRLTQTGADPAALDVLVNRRLLHLEERLDLRRIELTHDVLCGIVKSSRDLRREREAREAAERRLDEARAREEATRRALWRARAIAATCSVMMLLAIASSVFGYINLRRARAAEQEQAALRDQAEASRQAEASLRASADANARRARTEAAKSTQVATFMTRMLEGVDPDEAQGQDTTMLREILEQTEARLETELKDQPQVVADLRETIGVVYTRLGRYEHAIDILRQVVRSRRELSGNDSAELATALNHLGDALVENASFTEAEAVLREAIAIRRRLFGSDDPRTVEPNYRLSAALLQQESPDEALLLRQQALEICLHSYGEEHLEVARYKFGVASTLSQMGLRDPETTERLFKESLAVRRKLLGEEHSLVAQSLNSLGLFYWQIGRRDEAAPLIRDALAMRERLFGREHPEVAISLQRLSLVLRAEGRTEESMAALRESVAIDRKVLGDHQNTRGHLVALAIQLETLGGHEPEVEAVYREAAAMNLRLLGRGSRPSPQAAHRLARLLRSQGRTAEADRLDAELMEQMRAMFGPDHRQTLTAAESVAWSLLREDRLDEARALATDTAPRARATLGPGDRTSISLAWLLGFLDTHTGQAEAAINKLETVLGEARASLGPDDSWIRGLMRDLAEAHFAAGHLPEARSLMEDTLAQTKARVGAESPEHAYHLRFYAEGLLAQSDYAAAEAALREAAVIFERTATGANTLNQARHLLGVAVARQGRFDEAEPLLVGGHEDLRKDSASMIPFRRARVLPKFHANVIRFYTDWGKPEKAAEWQARTP